MKARIALAGIVLSLLAARTHAQNTPNHEHTTVPIDAGFELLQSPLGAKTTLRINRITGQTNQLVAGAGGRAEWEGAINGPDDPAGSSQGRLTYYAFSSGLAARWTFLMNVRTGATWQLTEDVESKRLFWKRVTEPER